MSVSNEPVAEQEIWRPVVGHEADYAVSDLGQIKNLRLSRILKAYPGRNGYLRVAICSETRALVAVASLVLTTFIGPRPFKQFACHNNGIKTDNRLSNLRWDTASANQLDRYKHGTAGLGAKNPNSVLTVDKVKQIRALSAAGNGPKVIGDQLGVAYTTVRHVTSRATWKHIE